jgi:hypothetical protein
MQPSSNSPLCKHLSSKENNLFIVNKMIVAKISWYEKFLAQRRERKRKPSICAIVHLQNINETCLSTATSHFGLFWIFSSTKRIINFQEERTYVDFHPVFSPFPNPKSQPHFSTNPILFLPQVTIHFVSPFGHYRQ